MPQVADAPLARVGQMPKGATVGARRMPVTNDDRLAILAGEKTELRHIVNPKWSKLRRTDTRTPGPCIVYTERADGLLLTDVIWADTPYHEPLTAISPESIKAEGYNTYDEWLAYMKRRHTDLKTMVDVRVTRVRRLTDEDIQVFKDAAYERLYGQYA